MSIEAFCIVASVAFLLGVGTSWRYWREKLRSDVFDQSKWN